MAVWLMLEVVPHFRQKPVTSRRGAYAAQQRVLLRAHVRSVSYDANMGVHPHLSPQQNRCKDVCGCDCHAVMLCAGT